MSDITLSTPLVSAQWLKNNWGRDGLKIVDTTYTLPFLNPEKNGAQLYEEAHIPDAIFFPLDEIADTSSDLPHMLAPDIQFSAQMSELGLSSSDAIVVYDQNGWVASARVWWNLRMMGHTNVAVLNGGLKAWKAANGAVVSGKIKDAKGGIFHAKPNPALVRDIEDMRQHVKAQDVQILDARNAARFKGEAAEPRAGLKSGHMPGAFNLTHAALIREDNLLKDKHDLYDVFAASGLDLDKPIVTTCGSGITASVLALGLAVIGRDDVAVYDGSWSQWGGADNCPVATGEAQMNGQTT
ncbi:3-mercaptopyruvate sulfurtransferase [Hirschia litorea]|uniref:3-mercaptopyruvate sulfurtransferase n=1 Tax=Hirschia litorea TaxID=1199156 RepID=A0ABW2IIQ9_9PROT